MDTRITADIILLHAPSVYDFRKYDDVVFGGLAESDSVNVTPMFEMYPLGFLVIKSYLEQHGLKVEIINIASLMLQYPELNVEKLLKKFVSPVFGIDIHWMNHSHGAIEIAALVKKIFPDSITVMGGISSTYYNRELLTYPQVDMVIKGYDTLDPLTQVVSCVKKGKLEDFKNIPNLVYRDLKGCIQETGFIHKPSNFDNASINWSYFKTKNTTLLNMPTLLMLTNAGCAHNCGWCGGSQFSYKNIMKVEKKQSISFRSMEHVKKEINSINKLDIPVSIYSLQAYSENKQRLLQYFDSVSHVNSIRSVHLELFDLFDISFMKQLAEKCKLIINLSPESHDLEISKLAGRGTYSMDDMEKWINQVLDVGVKGVYIWFMTGMPKQTPKSILETANYCRSLMSRFQNKPVVPTITPMAPFLDPGSQFFEEPAKYGYHLFFKSVEAHRQALIQPRWQDRFNYETKWLPRDSFLDCIYSAISKMTEYKGEHALIRPAHVKKIQNRLTKTVELLKTTSQIYEKDKKLPDYIKHEIHCHNQETLSYSSDSIFSIKQSLGNRWFDDYTVPKKLIEMCCD